MLVVLLVGVAVVGYVCTYPAYGVAEQRVVALNHRQVQISGGTPQGCTHGCVVACVLVRVERGAWVVSSGLSSVQAGSPTCR
jgi:hypothetical protein